MNNNYTVGKVKFPMKIKLISIITLMLVVSLSIYLIFALDLFYKDKFAYIFEVGLNTSDNIADQMSAYIGSAENNVSFLGTSYNITDKNDKIIEHLFNSLDNVVEFSIYSVTSNVPRQLLGIFDKTYLLGHELPEDYLSMFQKDVNNFFNDIKVSNIKIAVLNNKRNIPILQIIKFKESKKQIWHAAIDISKMIDIFKKDQIYNISIMYDSGQPFLLENENIEIEELATIANSGITGSKEITLLNGRKLLISSSFIPKYNLAVLAQIDYDKAFLVAKQLIEKSIYFGLLLISLFSIIGIVFSKTITSSIEKLFAGTTKMSEGDFNTKVTVKSNDEIGALADSFNYMSGEIVKYMSEMEEKLRLENELQIAKFVQSSFFPEKNISLPGIDLSAFYTHASECGGDWWGYIDSGEKTVIMIADATGHGVPAALLTATANCCLSNIKLMGENSPELLSSPSKMMTIINRAVFDAGSKILMSFFIGTIDKSNRSIIYANASHNIPLLYKYSEIISKNNFKSLICEPGPHLGKDQYAEYPVNSMNFSSNDTLFLFTDGIIEEEDEEGKPWGTRRFLKSIVEHINNSPEKLVENVVRDAFEYSANETPSDDVTFLSIRMV